MFDRAREILSFFQNQSLSSAANDFISGEQIAKELGYTRTSVWNHIDTLRKLGYEFEASPRLGYRLIKCPDLLDPDDIQNNLDTRFVGKKIYYFDETKSTNDVAGQLAHDGALQGTVVLAEYQSGGRGRLGRKWLSPKRKSILLSIILRPDLDPGSIPMMTVLSSVAVARTLRQLGCDARIKWPNDVLVDGKKIAGILTELECEQDRIKHLVLGIGLNVNIEEEEIPKDLKDLITSLSMVKGEKVDRLKVVKILLKNVEDAYLDVTNGRTEPILQEWSKWSVLVGRWVEVSMAHKKVEGVVLGTDSKGALLLKLENGFVEPILSGDVKIKHGS